MGALLLVVTEIQLTAHSVLCCSILRFSFMCKSKRLLGQRYPGTMVSRHVHFGWGMISRATHGEPFRYTWQETRDGEWSNRCTTGFSSQSLLAFPIIPCTNQSLHHRAFASTIIIGFTGSIISRFASLLYSGPLYLLQFAGLGLSCVRVPMSPVGEIGMMTSDQPTVALGSHSGCPSKATGYRGYHHITWYVGNAKQLASCYITRMGFEHIAYRGLETGSRAIASHVISNNGATFVLIAPIRPSDYDDDRMTNHDRKMLQEVHAHLSKHGDAVKDVAFEVDDARAVYSTAIAKGAGGVQEPNVEQDEEGEVVTAVLNTYGDVTHTLVERSGYRGAFLPGYCAVTSSDPSARLLPAIKFNGIDHCVGNQGWDQLKSACE